MFSLVHCSGSWPSLVGRAVRACGAVVRAGLLPGKRSHPRAGGRSGQESDGAGLRLRRLFPEGILGNDRRFLLLLDEIIT